VFVCLSSCHFAISFLFWLLIVCLFVNLFVCLFVSTVCLSVCLLIWFLINVTLDTREASLIKYDAKPFQLIRGFAVSPNGLYMAIYYAPSVHELECKGSYKQIEVKILLNHTIIPSCVTHTPPSCHLCIVKTGKG